MKSYDTIFRISKTDCFTSCYTMSWENNHGVLPPSAVLATNFMTALNSISARKVVAALLVLTPLWLVACTSALVWERLGADRPGWVSGSLLCIGGFFWLCCLAVSVCVYRAARSRVFREQRTQASSVFCFIEDTARHRLLCLSFECKTGNYTLDPIDRRREVQIVSASTQILEESTTEVIIKTKKFGPEGIIVPHGDASRLSTVKKS